MSFSFRLFPKRKDAPRHRIFPIPLAAQAFERNRSVSLNFLFHSTLCLSSSASWFSFFCSRHLERERELFGGITTEKLAYFAFEEERGKRKEETTGVGHWQEREQGACVERAVQQ